MASIEQLVEQRCDEYRQRAAELGSQLSESEQELRAAQRDNALLREEIDILNQCIEHLEHAPAPLTMREILWLSS